MKKLVFLLAFVTLTNTASAEGCPLPVKPTSKEFGMMEKLTGTWKGQTVKDGKPEEMKVTYRLTSGGSAIEEVLSPGSEGEMVSVYTEEKGKLAMIHYCMLGNHPKLQFLKATNNQINLAHNSSDGISEKDMHMHSLQITFNGPDTMTQVWTAYEKGEPKERVSFVLHRDISTAS